MAIKRENIVGVLPAAGRATRLGPIPCSKEILPVGSSSYFSLVKSRIKVVSHYLFESLACAGIAECILVLDPMKSDIPMYLKRNGGIEGFNIAYRYIENSPNTPTTLNAALPFVKDKWIALGFPDMVLPEREIFTRLLTKYDEGVDVLLGLFPARQPHNVDMVDIDSTGRIQKIVIKPQQTKLTETWGVAIWNPRFTELLHEYVTSRRLTTTDEIFVGDVFTAAIQKGFNVAGIRVSSRPYLDIGTPENYAELFTTLS